MATVQRYCNTASSGGDGTTNATSGGTAAYASMSSAEANMGGSATDDYILDCCGTAADTTVVTWDFATNLTTGTLLVQGNRSDAAGFYDGNLVISTSHYRLDPGNVIKILQFDEANTTIDGIQVVSGHTSTFGVAIQPPTANVAMTVKKCRVHATSTCRTGIGYPGFSTNSNATSTIENNLIVNFNTNGIELSSNNFFTPTYNIYHNTIYGDGSAVGISAASLGGSSAAVFNIKGNALANSGGSNDIVVSLTGTSAVNYADNATEDFDLGTTDEIDLGTTTDAWTSPGTTAASDFTVKNTSSSLYNAVNPTLVSTDITDYTRDGTNHDVGAFELVVAVANPKNVIYGIALDGPMRRVVL